MKHLYSYRVNQRFRAAELVAAPNQSVRLSTRPNDGLVGRGVEARVSRKMLSDLLSETKQNFYKVLLAKTASPFREIKYRPVNVKMPFIKISSLPIL